MRKLFALLLAVVMTVSLCACGSKDDTNGGNDANSGKTYTLTWAGIGSNDAIDTWIANEAASRIAAATDNHVIINVFPSSQLGDLTQAYDEIMAGSIDMGLFTVYGNYDIINEMNFTCFLTSNLDEWREVYAEGGFIYDTLKQVQADRGVTLMGFWPSGYLGLGFAKLAEGADTLFDCTVEKKELLRVPGMDTMMASAQALGYKTTTINYSDVYTALQTGVCDGSWNGGAYFLIVLCAIFLEKYLLTITASATFYVLIPLSCALCAAYILSSKRFFGELAWKIVCFGLAIVLIVPTSVYVSNVIEETYNTSISTTIEDAKRVTEEIQTDDSTNNTEESYGISGLFSKVTEGISKATMKTVDKFKRVLNNMIEALAVMLVTSCLIPILVIVFFSWLVKLIFGINIPLSCHANMSSFGAQNQPSGLF